MKRTQKGTYVRDTVDFYSAALCVGQQKYSAAAHTPARLLMLNNMNDGSYFLIHSIDLWCDAAALFRLGVVRSGQVTGALPTSDPNAFTNLDGTALGNNALWFSQAAPPASQPARIFDPNGALLTSLRLPANSRVPIATIGPLSSLELDIPDQAAAVNALIQVYFTILMDVAT